MNGHGYIQQQVEQDFNTNTTLLKNFTNLKTYNTLNSDHKAFDIMSQFEQGLQKDKFKKLKLRKDAFIIFNQKAKHDMIRQKQMKERTDTQSIKKCAFYELKNGKNLFECSHNLISNQLNIFEIVLSELFLVDIDILAYLPRLGMLQIKFSDNIKFRREFFTSPYKKHISALFPCLLYLDLSFNNLKGNIFEYIKNIPTLKKINLSGNKLTKDIPDLSNLRNLEDLNLSYNRICSQFVTNVHNVSINTDEFHINNDKVVLHKENDDKKTEIFEEWPYKTNIQDFFNKLSVLKSLETLNLSHNKIQFFDIDQFMFDNNQGFSNLKNLDLSNNKISDEMGIILVIKLPKLEYLNITNNPFYDKGVSNCEYEIFRNKNIIFSNEDNNKSSGGTTFNNKQKLIKNKNHEEILNGKNYIIKKQKLESCQNFSQYVKQRITNFIKLKNLEVEECGEVKNTESKIHIDSSINKETSNNEIERNYSSIGNLNNNHKDFFLTNDNPVIVNRVKKVNKNSSYDEFLRLANNCFGVKTHYGNSLPISKAYQRLRFVFNNLQTDTTDYQNLNFSKPTISNKMHLYKESSNLEEAFKEMSLISKKHNKLNNSLSFSLEGKSLNI